MVELLARVAPVERVRSTERLAGVRNGYLEPQRLGVDRLLAMAGAQAMSLAPALVVGVGTAAECLERLRSETFDCMVLDLSLPDASGYSALTATK